MEPLTFIKHLWFLPREQCQGSHNQVLDFRRTLSIFKLAMCLCFYFGILLIHFVHIIIVISHYCLIAAWFRNLFNLSSVLYNKQRCFIYMKTVHVSGIVAVAYFPGRVTQVPSVRLLTLLSAWKTQLSHDFTPRETYS